MTSGRWRVETHSSLLTPLHHVSHTVTKMDALTDIFAILGMFFLRLGVPLLLVFGVGYLLRRLDAQWEAEAREQTGTNVRQGQEQQRPGRRPSERPAPAVPQRLPAAPAYASVIDIFGQPCWAINDCDAAARENCPAYHQPGSPCWLARFQEEGHLPDGCQQCAIYAATSGAAIGAAAQQAAARQPLDHWLQ